MKLPNTRDQANLDSLTYADAIAKARRIIDEAPQLVQPDIYSLNMALRFLEADEDAWKYRDLCE